MKMNEEQVNALLCACYHEFCEIVGDSPCGCDGCPYHVYNTEENENGCYEEYIRDKFAEVENGNELDSGV